MTRTIAGLPLWAWLVGAAAFGGSIWWIKRGQQKSGQGGSKASAAPAFSKTQEIQDFQIYSQLTSAQQASDLSFVGTMLQLFQGGTSSGTTTGGGTATTTAPATTTTPTTTPTPAAAPASAAAPAPAAAAAPAPAAAAAPSPAVTTPTVTVLTPTYLSGAAGQVRASAPVAITGKTQVKVPSSNTGATIRRALLQGLG